MSETGGKKSEKEGRKDGRVGTLGAEARRRFRGCTSVATAE